MAKESPTFSPLYRQIKSLILQALEAGEWRPGQVIPSEQELALRFNVSQGTVRKAIDEIAADNILVRKQGKGTYVASHNDPRQMFRFLRLVPEDGPLIHPKSEPLDCWRAKAGQEAARMLAIESGAPIVIVRRVLKFDAQPIVADEIYLPGELFQGLTLEMLQSWNSSLYSLFETRFGLRMLRAQERIRAVAADREAADLLQVPEGTALLSVERVTYTYADKPVEWRRGMYSTADHYYLNDLT
ncbi:MAG: GntR family transcriptional regulator [Azoarcus sp.]|jgi:GntR family transcriptional regulator|nr:GntR family transcriptional regulator [Azoarcus sp.]